MKKGKDAAKSPKFQNKTINLQKKLQNEKNGSKLVWKVNFLSATKKI